jgi:hypothetical protein
MDGLEFCREMASLSWNRQTKWRNLPSTVHIGIPGSQEKRSPSTSARYLWPGKNDGLDSILRLEEH